MADYGVSSGPTITELVALINVGIVVAIIVIAGRKGIAAALRGRRDDYSSKLVEAKRELEMSRLEIQKARLEIAEIGETKRAMVASVVAEASKHSERLLEDAKQVAQRIVDDSRLAVQAEAGYAAESLRRALLGEAIFKTKEQLRGSESEDLRQKLHGRLFDKMIAELKVSSSHNGQGAAAIKNGAGLRHDH